jgi:hypothetical protein
MLNEELKRNKENTKFIFLETGVKRIYWDKIALNAIK